MPQLLHPLSQFLVNYTLSSKNIIVYFIDWKYCGVWQVLSYGETLPGLDQYAVTKFASALECFVKTLADNTGIKSSEIISKLYAAHIAGNFTYGFDIQVCISES